MQVTISNNIKIKNPSTEKTYVVYRHIFPNGKSYIGITCAKPYTRRWTSGARYRLQVKMHRAIEKYGWRNVTHELLFRDLTLDEAKDIEREMIAKYNSIENGYNVSAGGEGNFGHRHSEETKRKMSIAHKGRPQPWAAKNVLEYVRENGAWNKGKKLSPEHYKKVLAHAKSKGKPITAYDPITHKPLLHFDSCEAAARSAGVTPESIRKCLKGKCKTIVGYVWRYDNENI